MDFGEQGDDGRCEVVAPPYLLGFLVDSTELKRL